MTPKERLEQFIEYLHIPTSQFERICGLSNGYLRSTKGNFGASKLDGILSAYPQLNKTWLLSGSGDMLTPHISQTVNGDGNTAVAGNGNHVNTDIGKALDEIAAQRKLVEKSQEQIDRLLSIIENINNK